MKISNYRCELEEDERVLKIKITSDVSFSDMLLEFPILDKLSKKFGSQVIESDTSIFIDKNNGATVIRYTDKSVTLMLNNKELDIGFERRGFLFDDGDEIHDYEALDKKQKNALFDQVIIFMDNFDGINDYLPIDASKTFMFLRMGILNKRDASVVCEGHGVILYLNSFRSLDFKRLRLNVADSTTYEVVGSIEASLGEKDESNFSYAGNVSYKISDEYRNLGYATNALAELIDYINEVCDEYNRELYIASLVDDIAYQAVAIKNGAVLHYEGDVPDNDYLASLNKIKQIKIYKIANK